MSDEGTAAAQDVAYYVENWRNIAAGGLTVLLADRHGGMVGNDSAVYALLARAGVSRTKADAALEQLERALELALNNLAVREQQLALFGEDERQQAVRVKR